MKKLTWSIYINLLLAALFSLLCVSWHSDISLTALPLAAAFTALLGYAAFVCLLRRRDARKVPLVRRLFQYEPFVLITAFVLRRAGMYDVPFALDVLTSVL